MTGVLREQEQLGRALDRARAGEDRILANRVREEGAQLVSLLAGIFRMSHMHAPDNEAFNKPMRDLVGVLGRLAELLGAVQLAVVEDQVYLNEIRVRLEDRAEGIRELASELRRHGLGGLTFREPPAEATLRAMAGCIAQKAAETRPRSTLQAALEARGVTQIELSGVYRFRMTSEDASAARTPEDVSRRAASLADEGFKNLGAGRLPNPLPIRRAVAEMLARQDGLDTITGEVAGSSALASHTLRVTRLALLIGESAGLPESVMQDLGVSAMFHDVGYAAREGKDEAGGGYPPPYPRHPSAGARLLMRQRGFHEAKVRRARAVLAHHRDFNSRPRPSLLARVIRLAEDYDNLLRPKGGNLGPQEALSRMASGGGTRYDPVLLQALVNALGRWPPGATLTLEDGRLCRVIAPSRTRERFDKPLVRVERLPDGRPPAQPQVLDLLTANVRVRVPGAPTPVPAPAAAPAPPRPAAPTPPPTPAPAPIPPPPAAEPADDDFVLLDSAGPEAGPAPRTGEIYGGALAQLLADLHRERRSGRLTLRQGGAETGLDVSRGLVSAAAARAVLSPAYTWDEGEYRFEERTVPAPADALSLGPVILEAVRALADPDVVRYELGELARVVAPPGDARLAGQKLPLDRDELFVLSAVEGRPRAGQVLALVQLPPERAQRALLGLIRAGLVELK